MGSPHPLPSVMMPASWNVPSESSAVLLNHMVFKYEKWHESSMTETPPIFFLIEKLPHGVCVSEWVRLWDWLWAIVWKEINLPICLWEVFSPAFIASGGYLDQAHGTWGRPPSPLNYAPDPNYLPCGCFGLCWYPFYATGILKFIMGHGKIHHFKGRMWVAAMYFYVNND